MCKIVNLIISVYIIIKFRDKLFSSIGNDILKGTSNWLTLQIFHSTAYRRISSVRP